MLLDMKKIMIHELQGGGQKQSIVFHIVGDSGGGYDDYGNPRPTHLIGVFDLKYSMDDLQKVNWENLPSENRLLNFSQVSNVTEAGTSVAQSYCKEEREYAQIFCENF
jgi:hypothetical protein